MTHKLLIERKLLTELEIAWIEKHLETIDAFLEYNKPKTIEDAVNYSNVVQSALHARSHLISARMNYIGINERIEKIEKREKELESQKEKGVYPSPKHHRKNPSYSIDPAAKRVYITGGPSAPTPMMIADALKQALEPMGFTLAGIQDPDADPDLAPYPEPRSETD